MSNKSFDKQAFVEIVAVKAMEAILTSNGMDYWRKAPISKGGPVHLAEQCKEIAEAMYKEIHGGGDND